MSTILTAVAVAKFRPKKRRYEVRDARSSLRLLVFPSGKRSWVLRFRRPDGRSAKLTLGIVHTGEETEGKPVIGGPLTLAAARKLAAEVDLDRASGKDPAAEHRAAKRQRRTEAVDQAANSFATCARRFIKEHAAVRTRKWKVTARFLGLEPDGALIPHGLAERWRAKPVATIDGHCIHDLIQEVRRHGVPGLQRRREGTTEGQARSMHSYLSKFFSWLCAQRLITVNPCTGLARPQPNKSRKRVLSNDEIRIFWRACDQLGGPFTEAYKVMLLTGARPQEVVGMPPEEVKDSMWELPGNRTKNGLDHMVPLAPLVREIIAGAMKPRTPYVFTCNGRTRLGGFSAVKRRLDALMPDVPAWQLRDLRRTCATGMAELGIAPHIVEACLNHVSGAKASVAGIYNRAAYLPERKAALERWADHVVGLERPANVVALRG